MNSDKVYLTFATDKETSDLLKLLAHSFKMTQPELINTICKQAIQSIKNKVKEDGLIK